MAFARNLVLCALLCYWSKCSFGARLRVVAPNPIRRIVDLLQDMQAKIEAEGVKEQKLFDSYTCYCHTTKAFQRKEIASANENIPQLETTLKEDSSLKAQLESEIERESMSLAYAEASLKAANAQRAKEAAVFQKLKDRLIPDLAALDKAIKVIEKGMSAEFLQTRAADRLKELTQGTSLNELDRQTLLAFLSGRHGYEPQSGEILGILKEMHNELSVNEAEEQTAKEAHSMLADSKQKEIKALKNSREVKTARVGEVALEISNLRADLDDSKASLATGKTFLKDLIKNCKAKSKDWQIRSKARNEELIAIGETIKILNSDDTRELIKKTAPKASFLQLQAVNSIANTARSLLRPGRLAHYDERLNLISMSLKARKVNVANVIKMIKDMLKLLQEEQKHDETKNAFCNKELDETEDEEREVGAIIKKFTKLLVDAKAKVASFEEEIDALDAGLAALDKQVSEATEQRKMEHARYTEELAENRAAGELLNMAKKRLLKFYNSDVAKPTASPDDEDAVPEFVQVSELQGDVETSGEGGGEEEEQQEPEAPTKDYEKSKDGGRAVGMISKLQGELADESTEMMTEEKEAQQEYEQLVKDAKEKRTSDGKKRAELEGIRAGMEEKKPKGDSRDESQAE